MYIFDHSGTLSVGVIGISTTLVGISQLEKSGIRTLVALGEANMNMNIETIEIC